MKKILSFIFLFSVFLLSSTNLSSQDAKGSILEGKIEISSGNKETPQIIQPGKDLIISVKVTNVGKEVNKPGHFYVRFAYPTPLADRPKSELYISEKIQLPPINPGSEATVQFKKTQATPSIYDFVRNDYAMRQYQAVVVIDNKDYLIGTASLTFSAQYYPGTPQEIETSVPAYAPTTAPN